MVLQERGRREACPGHKGPPWRPREVGRQEERWEARGDRAMQNGGLWALKRLLAMVTREATAATKREARVAEGDGVETPGGVDSHFSVSGTPARPPCLHWPRGDGWPT